MSIQNIIEFILYKNYTEIKSESARSYLGLIWWIIEPLIYLGAFYVLFVIILKRGSPNFVPFFLCGVVVWKWFASGVQSGSQAISIYRSILLQVYVPKFIFPIIVVVGSTSRFIPIFIIFSFFLLFYGMPVHVTWVAVPFVVLTQFCLIIALVLLASGITPFLPDFKVAIDNGILMLFFLSGVFFDINEVQEPVKSYLLLNPMAGIIDEYRNIMIRGLWPDVSRMGYVLLFSLATGSLGLAILKIMDRRYGKVRF
ncbi:MAG: ABC transporter permease [Desulfobacterales bacterium]|jgi:lipopolysaccharide transport system permease protein